MDTAFLMTVIGFILGATSIVGGVAVLYAVVSLVIFGSDDLRHAAPVGLLGCSVVLFALIAGYFLGFIG